MPDKKIDVLDCLQSIADSLQKAVALLERIADKVAHAGSENKTAKK